MARCGWISYAVGLDWGAFQVEQVESRRASGMARPLATSRWMNSLRMRNPARFLSRVTRLTCSSPVSLSRAREWPIGTIGPSSSPQKQRSIKASVSTHADWWRPQLASREWHSLSFHSRLFSVMGHSLAIVMALLWSANVRCSASHKIPYVDSGNVTSIRICRRDPRLSPHRPT